MTKFCSNCGKKLEENADICLNCGVLLKKNSKPNKQKKEKKKGLPIWAIVLIIIGCIVLLPIIVIVMVGIFAYNIVQDSDIDFDEYINDIVDEETTIYGTIDDTLNTNSFKITLIDSLIYSSIGETEDTLNIPKEGKEYLVFFFDIENISNTMKGISAYNFSGYADEYSVPITYIMENIDGYEQLEAELSSNKKTKGYVAFEVDQNWKEFEIHYNDLEENKNLIFTVVNSNESV